MNLFLLLFTPPLLKIHVWGLQVDEKETACLENASFERLSNGKGIQVHNLSVTGEMMQLFFELSYPKGLNLSLLNVEIINYDHINGCDGIYQGKTPIIVPSAPVFFHKNGRLMAQIDYPVDYAKHQCQFTLLYMSVTDRDCNLNIDIPFNLKVLEIQFWKNLTVTEIATSIPTSTTVPTTTPPSSGTELTFLIFIIILAVVLSCMVVFAMYKWYKTGNKSNQDVSLEIHLSDDMVPSVSTDEHSEVREYKEMLKFTFQIPRNGLDVVRIEINTGANGVVKKACSGLLSVRSVQHNDLVYNALHMNHEPNEQVEVAVKQLPGTATETHREAGLNEALINVQIVCKMKYHENIAMFLGACTTAMPYQLVIEYCNMGSLLEALRNSRKHVRQELGHESAEGTVGTSVLTLRDLIKMAVDICYGMDHMHTHGFVHRDLACRNILLHKKTQPNSRIVAKITDFGLTRKLDEQGKYVHTDGGKLPAYLESLEARSEGLYSAASDCWAMGVLLYEMVTYGHVPYAVSGQPGTRPNPHDLLEFLRSGQRLPIPAYCDEQLGAIILKCWCENPSDRPSMIKLSQELSEYLNSLPNQIQDDPLDMYLGDLQLAEDNYDDYDDYVPVDNSNMALNEQRMRRLSPGHLMPNTHIGRLSENSMSDLELSSSRTTGISVIGDTFEDETYVNQNRRNLASEDYINVAPINNRNRHDSGVTNMSTSLSDNY